jgi:lipoyl-dependent peroxiredoxin
MPTKLIDINYTTSAAAKGGRTGHVRSGDGVVDLDLGKPGSTAHPKANPETLFAAGYAACFQGALTARAAQQEVDASDSSVTATVSFGSASDGGFGLAVALEASIPGVDKVRTQELMELAHEVCPYSKATRDNIVVTLTAV